MRSVTSLRMSSRAIPFELRISRQTIAASVAHLNVSNACTSIVTVRVQMPLVTMLIQAFTSSSKFLSASITRVVEAASIWSVANENTTSICSLGIACKESTVAEASLVFRASVLQQRSVRENDRFPESDKQQISNELHHFVTNESVALTQAKWDWAVTSVLILLHKKSEVFHNIIEWSSGDSDWRTAPAIYNTDVGTEVEIMKSGVGRQYLFSSVVRIGQCFSYLARIHKIYIHIIVSYWEKKRRGYGRLELASTMETSAGSSTEESDLLKGASLIWLEYSIILEERRDNGGGN